MDGGESRMESGRWEVTSGRYWGGGGVNFFSFSQFLISY